MTANDPLWLSLAQWCQAKRDTQTWSETEHRRETRRDLNKNLFGQNIKKRRRASGVMLKSVTDVTIHKQKNNNRGAHDKLNGSTSSFRTGSCQHNASQCCTSIWASARSLNTVSQSFYEYFITERRFAEKEYDFILLRGVRNTLTIKKRWHFNEPQTKAFTECAIIAANPKKKHYESFAKPIKHTLHFHSTHTLIKTS